MEGNAIYMHNQLGTPHQEGHYKEDFVNGNQGSGVVRVDESTNNLSEDIIKNIAVEKDLSEIASAYNLHRSENNGERESLEMGVDTPSDSRVINDKYDHVSDPPAHVESQEAKEYTQHSTEIEPAASLKDNGTHNQSGENGENGEDSNNKDIDDSKTEESMDTTDKDSSVQNPDSEAAVNNGDQDSQDGSTKQADSNEDSQDETNENNKSRQNGDETAQDTGNEEEEGGNTMTKVKVKQEVQSDDEEPFVEGQCNLCHGEMDTTDHITMSKHLSEVHVLTTEHDNIKCGVCNRVYQERRSAVRHILNQHLNYKPYKCEQCPKSFARRDHLSRHEKQHDPPAVECKFCNQEFEDQSQLDRHFRQEHSTDTKKRKSRSVTYEEIDSDADMVEESDSADSEDAFVRSWSKKSGRRSSAPKSKRPQRSQAARGRPKKKVPAPVILKRESKSLQLSKAQQKKLDKEREEQRKKKEKAQREREALRRKKEKQRMRDEEAALERLREKERMKELREKKERAIREEMKKKAEELARKQREEDEHYFDGNFWEPPKTSFKEWTSGPDENSVYYTNFYGGNYHEPPKKTLSQIAHEKKVLQETLLSGGHFLAGSNIQGAGSNIQGAGSNDILGKAIKEEVDVDVVVEEATPGICGLCGQEYDESESQALSKHVYEKHQSAGTANDRVCPVCNKEYSERKGLNRHILHYHLNYKPHQCSYCPKHFSRRDHLTRHLEKHKGQTNKHICEFCQKSFSRREHLNRHMWVHKDTFKYKCEYCTKAYTKEEHLSRHVNDSHLSRTLPTGDNYVSATLI